MIAVPISFVLTVITVVARGWLLIVLECVLMSNPSKHISILKMFSSGDADEWFSCFEICCKANDWNAATKAAKLPTLLEGGALAVWLELTEEDKEDYGKAKKASYFCLPSQLSINLTKERCFLAKLYPYSYMTSKDYLVTLCQNCRKKPETSCCCTSF